MAASLLETFVRYLGVGFGEPVGCLRLASPGRVAEVARVAGGQSALVVACQPSGLADSPRAFGRLLTSAGVPPQFVGWAPGGGGELVAVVEPGRCPARRGAPGTFRVLAIVPTYNEADIIGSTLRALIEDEGIDVYVLDNWSTDATVAIARQFEGRGLAGLERFPASGPCPTYNLRQILARIEEIATEQSADWYVLHDADERRRSAWPGLGLRDALFEVDARGFNCVDHITLNFWPVDNGFDARYDPEDYFHFFELSGHPGHFHQRRAWKNTHQPVALVPTAGHDVTFPGRRVFPYRFLLKHYPLRSQQHAERKVLAERRARWNAEERSLGWHAQYDELGPSTFLRDPARLERFDATFFGRRLVERLSGVGVFSQPPDWATPPHWG